MRLIDKFKIKSIWDKYYTKGEEYLELFEGTIYEMLLNRALKMPLFKAISYYDQVYSYSDMLNEIDKVASSLIRMGLKKGDVITIIMPNTPEALFMFYGANKIGVISSMLHPLLGEEEIKEAVNNTKSNFVLAIDLCYNKLIDIIDETNIQKVVMLSASKSMKWYYKAGYFVTKGYKISKPKYNSTFIEYSTFINMGRYEDNHLKAEGTYSDAAAILHSGGTTGTPKGILISNLNMNAMAQQLSYLFKYNNFDYEKDRGSSLAILPIFHGFGLVNAIHTPLVLGLKVHLLPQFDAKTFDKELFKEKPVMLLGVPSLFDYLRKSKFLDKKDLSFLRFSIAGGDKINLEMENAINDFYLSRGSKNLAVGYGLTEATAAVITSLNSPRKKDTVGIPVFGNDIKIVNPGTDEELKNGETGEIVVSGPTVMMGYLNNDAETNLALRKYPNGKVYLHTGDMGFIDEEGYIHYVQRIKRMIITSGYNVYPAYIEKVLSEHPAVLLAVVVGKKHKYKGEVVHAYIVLKEGFKETHRLKKELRALAEKNLAKYSLPYEYHFRKSLPQTRLGKVNYRELEEDKND